MRADGLLRAVARKYIHQVGVVWIGRELGAEVKGVAGAVCSFGKIHGLHFVPDLFVLTQNRAHREDLARVIHRAKVFRCGAGGTAGRRDLTFASIVEAFVEVSVAVVASVDLTCSGHACRQAVIHGATHDNGVAIVHDGIAVVIFEVALLWLRLTVFLALDDAVAVRVFFIVGQDTIAVVIEAVTDLGARFLRIAVLPSGGRTGLRAMAGAEVV